MKVKKLQKKKKEEMEDRKGDKEKNTKKGNEKDGKEEDKDEARRKSWRKSLLPSPLRYRGLQAVIISFCAGFTTFYISAVGKLTGGRLLSLL